MESAEIKNKIKKRHDITLVNSHGSGKNVYEAAKDRLFNIYKLLDNDIE